jgi:HD-GYP domain-containing protein (c-di-GMP phosphodiesterase class II)
MTRTIKAYVGAVLAAALAVFALVYAADPTFRPAYLNAAISFAVLGVISQLFSYRGASERSTGSIAFLPLLTIVVVAPDWTGLLTIAAAVAVAETVGRRAFVKRLFNVAAVAVAAGVCIAVYRALGGVSLLEDSSGVYAAAAVTLPLFLLVNTVLVYGVLALSTGRNFWEMLSRYSPKTIAYDLLALPFVYVFVRFYAEFGPAAAAFLAIPMLGLRELYKTNAQLQRTNRELLDLMVAAIEARDPYTSGHSRRVAANTRVIAEMLGLGRKEVERIYVAALLHDVGKIHEVFGPILSKPGKLTADEFAIMKTHCGLGAELIQRLTDLQDCVLPVLHHHENWDGTGYPHGIAGERIPLWSRIIMFADTADAMMSDRPYRAALSAAQVRAEFMRLKGKQFDPYICEILLGSPSFDQLFANAPPREAVGLGNRVTPVRPVSLAI